MLQSLRKCYLFRDCRMKYLDALLSVAKIELFMPGSEILCEGALCSSPLLTPDKCLRKPGFKNDPVLYAIHHSYSMMFTSNAAALSKLKGQLHMHIQEIRGSFLQRDIVENNFTVCAHFCAWLQVRLDSRNSQRPLRNVGQRSLLLSVTDFWPCTQYVTSVHPVRVLRSGVSNKQDCFSSDSSQSIAL